MCYYNGIRVTRSEYIRLKDLEKLIANYSLLDIPLAEGPLYSQAYPVLKAVAGKEDFELVNMEWGFLPEATSWPFIKTREEVKKFRYGYKDEKGWHKGYITLNATAENLFVNEFKRKSMYADAAMSRRCLVPSTGFWEWRHVVQIGKKGQPLKEPAKYPYHVYLPEHADRPFYMAGIYNTWTDEETGEHVDTFAVITTAANKLMEQVHNAKRRMPTILDDDLAWEWMFGKLDPERVSEIAKTQYPTERMAAYPVDKKFKEAVDPRAAVEYAELGPLELA